MGKFHTVSMVLRAKAKGILCILDTELPREEGVMLRVRLPDGRKGPCETLKGEMTWRGEWKLDLRNLWFYFRESGTTWCSLKQHPCCL